MPPSSYQQILGVQFFTGTAADAVEAMEANRGLLVVPAAPALKDLSTNLEYRRALLEADLCIPDSMYMIYIWNLLQRDHLVRVSGLEYLRLILQREDFRAPGATFWVMANADSAAKNLAWLREQGAQIPETHVYLAPMYGPQISDAGLLATLERLRPPHIVVTIGGGNQERLGLYLRRSLTYRPAIHCIGAAIAFLSGDQVHIPVWADRYGFGWLLRCISEPRRYIPRYWAARKLFSLMRKYRAELPPVKT